MKFTEQSTFIAVHILVVDSQQCTVYIIHSDTLTACEGKKIKNVLYAEKPAFVLQSHMHRKIHTDILKGGGTQEGGKKERFRCLHTQKRQTIKGITSAKGFNGPLMMVIACHL